MHGDLPDMLHCRLIAFPPDKQVGRIRGTALKLWAKGTDRHADYYRGQVTEAIEKKLARIGVPEDEQDEMIGAFWRAVELEVARLAYLGRRSDMPRRPDDAA